MTKNRLLNQKGSAIITAVGMGTILAIIILAVFTLSRSRIQTVIRESKKVKAFAFAEAGLEVALGQLYNNSNFETHGLNIDGKELKWDNSNPKDCTNTIANNSDGFSEPIASKGTVYGKLGDGEYKVRVGNVPWGDNPHTKTVDESKAYLKIESIGKFENTYRKIVAIVNRRFPTREFLMYDSGILSVVYGQTGVENSNASKDYNVFSIGNLYGEKGIEISQILNSAHSNTVAGTKQRLFGIDSIISGSGGIFFYSEVPAVFLNNKGNVAWNNTIQKNQNFPNNGTYPNSKEACGEFPKELENVTPTIPNELKTWIKDRNDGVSIPVEVRFEDYLEAAKTKGKHYTSSTNKYRVPSAYNNSGYLDVVYLDFGTQLHDANINKDEYKNGIIYSNKDMVIKGNPPRDVTIVSEKNIFIAGDFNQKGIGSNDKYGFPQKYGDGKNALSADDYATSSKELFAKDPEKDCDSEDRCHVSATIVAKERIVFDHRSPLDCFENELYPYLKYELAKGISETDVTTQAEDIFKAGNNFGVTASSTVEGYKQKLASFTERFKIADSEGLINELEKKYTDGNFSDTDLDEMTKIAWKAYAKDFEGSNKGELSNSSKDIGQGIYQLLFRLRAKMCGKTPDETGIIEDLYEPSDSSGIKKQDDYLCYPEMTTNGMFVSCGKLNNEYYSGPDVKKYFDEIGVSDTNIGQGFVKKWYYKPEGFLHRLYGTETNLRQFEVVSTSGNKYKPPLRKKIYDDTLAKMGKNNSTGTNVTGKLDLAGFVIMSWEDFATTEKEYNEF